jgi:hypothetical protein
VEDITTAATCDNLAEQWRWVDHARQSRNLGASPPLAMLPPESGFVRADKYGYRVAQELRARASLPANGVLDSVEDLANRALGIPLRVVHENHLVGREIKLIAGRAGSGSAELVGPGASHPEDERFRIARGLFQVAVASARGPRLVTDAFTWNQRASRACAAELIAPQQALKERAGHWADRSTIRQLASEYQASTILIEKQLRNAQVPIIED